MNPACLQASVTVKADPVDSTMHELGGGPSHEPAWEQHNTGPTLLHGAPVASMVTLLQLMASMFPAVEGDDSWQELADAAAKEEGYVLRLCAIPGPVNETSETFPRQPSLRSLQNLCRILILYLCCHVFPVAGPRWSLSWWSEYDPVSRSFRPPRQPQATAAARQALLH